jgi:hypothetical protein
VRLAAKVGVSIMSLLVFATPIMACALPAIAMTMAERECCKRMAHDCGKSGMPQSHSCCQTTAAPDHLPAIKSSSDVTSKHSVSVLIHPLPQLSAIAVTPEFASLTWTSDVHSPPVSPPISISVLRI